MRPSTLAFSLLATLVVALVACFVDAACAVDRRAGELTEMKQLVAQLGLTDPALFTEARYTRHPTQADVHSAFQDHPLALEHFPSGSLLPPRHDALAHPTTTPD